MRDWIMIALVVQASIKWVLILYATVTAWKVKRRQDERMAQDDRYKYTVDLVDMGRCHCSELDFEDCEHKV